MPDNDDNYKEVFYEAYCPSCKYSKVVETDEPCDTCMANPYAKNSHKPVCWVSND